MHAMEIDMHSPSFRTPRKRTRSRSPSPCERARPLKRPAALAVGDGAHEPPPSFTPGHYAPQDEPWVARTRSLTLLPIAPLHTSCSADDSMMNLDDERPPAIHIDNTLAAPARARGASPSLVLPAAALAAFLQAPRAPALPTPPLSSVHLPPTSPFSSGASTPLLQLPPQQQQQQQQQPLTQALPQQPRPRTRFTMGPRPDCEKCRLGVPGHYAHFD